MIPAVWILVMIFVGVYFSFYPLIYAFRDESIYMALTYVLRQGTIFIEQTNIPVSMFVSIGQHWVPMYPIGHSLLMLPLSLVHWKAMFLIGLMSHLANVFLIRKLSDYFKVDKNMAGLLFLFYPAFVFYSRTMMTDIPSLTLFLVAYVFFFRDKPNYLWVGFFLGLNLFYRVSNLFYVAPFAFVIGLRAFQQKKVSFLFRFLLGFIPFGLALGYYQWFVYGNPFLNGYSTPFTGVHPFKFSHFSTHAFHYLMGLMLVYPFMLPLAFLSSVIRKVEVIGVVVTGYFMFSFYYFRDSFFGNIFLEWCFGNRFLFPIIPFLILGYTATLQPLLQKLPLKISKVFTSLLCVGLMVGGGAIHIKHQSVLREQDELRRVIYNNTSQGDAVFYDSNAAELIQFAWGERDYYRLDNPKEFLRYLASVKTDQRIFFVTRDITYRNVTSPALNAKIFMSLPSSYKTERVLERSGLYLFRVRV